MYNLRPLVSIVMPCYNGRKTLPMALASLVCQTYDKWELIFVDDGSIDGSADYVEAIGDNRFRVIRLDRNYGRGIAYQRGKNDVHGEFMAILDSDDWWYSTKLEKQIEYLLNHPEVSLVGGGMVIVDKENSATGYRCNKHFKYIKMTRLGDPPLAFATICMRKEISDKYSFNSKYAVGQDEDFLRRFCLEECFANLSEIIYVYTEYQTYDYQKIYQGLLNRIKALGNLRSKFPIQYQREITKNLVKMMFYWIIKATGQEKAMISRRSSPLSKEMLEVYVSEKEKVEAIAKELVEKSHISRIPM